jgi:hypothetical protein
MHLPADVPGFGNARDELQRSTASQIQLARDERIFPVHSLAFSRLFVTTEPTVVGFCANDQDARGLIQLVEHPTRPAFERGAIHVLVEQGLDAIRAQSFREREHALAMLS